jgi:hypothetical protein
MRYTGKLFHPAGAELELDLAGLSPIQGHLAFDVFAQIKQRMENDQFVLQIDASPTYLPTMMAFRRYGQTAGVVRFAPSGGEDVGPLDAALAILPRLDRADDIAALGSLLEDPELSGVIAGEDFEAAHRFPKPLTAAFFASEEALNAPLLHGLMSLSGAAFFDRLGLLD